MASLDALSLRELEMDELNIWEPGTGLRKLRCLKFYFKIIPDI